MAVKKSLFLLGVILAFVLLTSLNMAYANEVTEANDSKGNNLEPAVEQGLNDEQVFAGSSGRRGQRGYGPGGYGGGCGYGGRRGYYGVGYGRSGYYGGGY